MEFPLIVPGNEMCPLIVQKAFVLAWAHITGSVRRWRKNGKSLLQTAADPEPHCIRPSSGHFAFVSRKLSGVEMEAGTFIIPRDVTRFLTDLHVDWSRTMPIIFYTALCISVALPLAAPG
ncbi:hypothetical protein GOODEAATRI_001114 [Goodea atripinnis]|uniref:Uncharacterized protein n=1 Tax=Goodea atripinnis TaxID=208336 RepID=A0ABV0PAE1_9TELE